MVHRFTVTLVNFRSQLERPAHFFWKHCRQIGLCASIMFPIFLSLTATSFTGAQLCRRQNVFPAANHWIWKVYNVALDSHSSREVQDNIVPANLSCKHTRKHAAVICSNRTKWHEGTFFSHECVGISPVVPAAPETLMKPLFCYCPGSENEFLLLVSHRS